MELAPGEGNDSQRSADLSMFGRANSIWGCQMLGIQPSADETDLYSREFNQKSASHLTGVPSTAKHAKITKAELAACKPLAQA